MTTIITSTVVSSLLVTPGTKDSEGFLTPPPASTLLLRRTRVNSTGSPSYVIAAPGNTSPSTSSGIGTSGSASLSLTTTPNFLESSSMETTRGRSTSGRSIKRPKFDDERVFSDTFRKKDFGSFQSVVTDTTSASNVSSPFHSPLTSSVDPSLALISEDNVSHDFTSVEPSTSTGKVMKLKVSKGKPASFMSESVVADMKKQRKERAPDKTRNVDPRTGKRRYIKKKDFLINDRPSFARTVSQSSEVSITEAGETVATWRPEDDLRLIINAKQTCDLNMVHVGTTFSCDFTKEHIEARWKNLLYSKNVSKVSQLAIMNLHSKVKANISAQSLYSKEEDELLKTVRSTCEKSTVLLKLEELLNENALVFLKWRTVKHLYVHWKELREFHLLFDQSQVEKSGKKLDVKLEVKNEDSFADIEDTMTDSKIQMDSLDSAVYQELLIENKHMRRKIRLAEEELVPWKVMAEMASEIEPTREGGEDSSFAILRGDQVRYLMRSREISIGRRTDTNRVDADLSLEGSTYKISKRQGVIQLRNSGDFVFLNEGKHSVYLDGEILFPRHTGRLRDQSIIQISGLKFIFLINQKMVYNLQMKLVEDLELMYGYHRNATALGKVNTKLPSSYVPPMQSVLVPSNNLSQPSSNVRPTQLPPPRYSPGAVKGFPKGTPYGIPASRSRGTAPALHHPQFSQLNSGRKAGFTSTLPSPAIFRRSMVTETPRITTQNIRQVQPQTSFQFGDLTIRPGTPPNFGNPAGPS